MVKSTTVRVFLPNRRIPTMTPADIAAAELRAGLSRRLAELGLIPPDPAIFRVSELPVPPAPAAAVDDTRKAA
jgi:hypothetical protein